MSSNFFASYSSGSGGGGGGGSGTVTSVSVVNANGLNGTVANPTTTPAITMSTTVTGVLQGNGTAISAATTGNLTDVGTDGITVTGGTGAVLGSGTSLSQAQASGTQNGFLAATDWTTFNNKQSAITTGNLTDSATDGITITGGTGAVIGSGTSIQQAKATALANGYLSSTDWSTFNNKQSTITTGNLTDAGTDGITVTGGTGSVIGSGTSIAQAKSSASQNGYLSSADWSTFNGKGSGTVTSVSVASSNGFAGSSSGGATPSLTLSTSVTGVLQGNGTAISAATTTGSGNVVLQTSPTFVTPALGTPSSGNLSNTSGYPVVVPGTSSGAVSSSGLTGNTTGSAIATGFVGETISAAITGATATGTYTNISANLVLTPGIWMIHYDISLAIVANINTSSPNFSQIVGSVGLFNGGGSPVSGTERSMLLQNPAQSAGGGFGIAVTAPVSFTGVLQPTTSTTYTVALKDAVAAGSGSVTANNSSPNSSQFYATRIA